jgi:NADPH oxidase
VALPAEALPLSDPHSVWITMWGGILYFMERLYREYRVRRETKIVGVLMHPSGAMEIRFQKPSFKYRSGQWRESFEQYCYQINTWTQSS